LYFVFLDKGEMFAWGCNELGQGDPSEIGNIIYHPKRVTLPRGIEKVTDVAIGDYFSFLLNRKQSSKDSVII
jgi:hypothetical protein